MHIKPIPHSFCVMLISYPTPEYVLRKVGFGEVDDIRTSTVGVLNVCIFKTLRHGRTIETRKRIVPHTHSVSGCTGIGGNAVFVVNRKKTSSRNQNCIRESSQGMRAMGTAWCTVRNAILVFSWTPRIQHWILARFRFIFHIIIFRGSF